MMTHRNCAIVALMLAALPCAAQAQQNPASAGSATVEQRARKILSGMTTSDKVAYLLGTPGAAGGMPVLGSAEALHGINAAASPFTPGKDIPTTSFGQVIGMGETWDPALIREAGSTMSYEARYITQSPKYHRPSLVLWAPNAELDRDPRWGRNEESYGEDPFLTGTMAAAYVQGIQGSNPDVWMCASLVKHFFANSNETTRGSSTSNFDARLLHEYYAVPYRMAFVQGGARSLMASYNEVNGVPMTVNPLLKTLAREQWGVNGILSSDAGAIENMVSLSKFEPSLEDAYAAAVKAGINQFLRFSHDDFLSMALKDGKLKDADLDEPILGKLRTTLRLGLLDPQAQSPYAAIGKEGEPDPWTLPSHKATARRVVEESVVLLKNDGLLPLSPHTIKRIAVIGPGADKVLTGGLYDAILSYAISPLEGIRAQAGPGVDVTFTKSNQDGAAVRAAKRRTSPLW